MELNFVQPYKLHLATWLRQLMKRVSSVMDIARTSSRHFKFKYIYFSVGYVKD